MEPSIKKDEVMDRIKFRIAYLRRSIEKHRQQSDIDSDFLLNELSMLLKSTTLPDSKVAFDDAQLRGTGMMEISAEGTKHIPYDDFMLSVSTSKADTDAAIPTAVLDALVEGCAQAFARSDSAGCEDAEACSRALGLYRDWKSATPSTIKADPTGEQL